MLKKLLSLTVTLAICLAFISAMPLADAAAIGFRGAGTEDSPYLISTPKELKMLADTVKGGNDCSGLYFRLERDIDLSGLCGEDIGGKEVSWTPIGAHIGSKFSFSGTAFSGIFDGNEHEIAGLYINVPGSGYDGYYMGLFGYISGGTVKNLGVDGYVNGYRFIGGVVGYNENGTVENCYNNGKVTGAYGYIGGIAGDNEGGTVKNCHNSGEVSHRGSSTCVGGVVGYNGCGTTAGKAISGTIDNCCNTGKVSGYNSVGGIAGLSNGEGIVQNCQNNGEVLAEYGDVGGIVGYNGGGAIVKKCYNNGVVLAKGSPYVNRIAGGIVGTNEISGIVQECINGGKVSADYNVGGIAGENKNSTVQDCRNTGEISSTYDRTGGIAGVTSNAAVHNCYNFGKVSGGYDIGGIVGYNGKSSIVKKCSNAGEVLGSYCIGGIVGSNYSEVQNCYNTGDFTCSLYYAGGIGGDNHEDATLQNCYSIGKLVFIGHAANASACGGVLGINEAAAQNCYYLESTAEAAIGRNKSDETTNNVESKPLSSFTYGEIAYILQGLQNDEDGLVWGQRLTTEGEHDESPILTDNHGYKVITATFMNGGEELAKKYINPSSTFTPPQDALITPPEGYALGWSAEQSGEAEIFYDMVTVGDIDEDITFYARFVLLPKDPTVTPPEPIDGLVYDRTEQQLITPGSAEGGTMVYSKSEEEEYSTDIPTGMNAGDYTVWYKVTGDEGYNDTLPLSLTVTIDKAVPAYTVPELTAVKGQTLADVKLPEGFTWDDDTQDVGEVGENSFAATYTPKDTDNFYTVPLMLKIKVAEPPKADPKVTPPEPIDGLVYDRTEQALITPGSAEGGTMVYSLSEEGEYSTDIPTGENAGEYTVWYKVTGDKGYNDTLPRSLTVTIDKAIPVYTVPELTAVKGQILADVKLPEGFTWDDDTQSVGDVGENSFAAAYTPKDTDNFYTVSLMLKIKVTEPPKADPKVTPPEPIDGLVYDRTEQALITPGSAEGGTMVYRLDGEQEAAAHAAPSSDSDGYSTDIPTGMNAGDYTIWYKVIGDEGYNDTQPQPLTVTIDKAIPDYIVPELTAVKGQTLAEVELPEGFTWDDDTQNVGDVGENSFAATFTPEDTHNFRTVSLTLTVTVTEPEEEETTTETEATAEPEVPEETTEVTESTTTTEAEAAETTTTTTTIEAATTTTPAVTETTDVTYVEDKPEEDGNLNTGTALALLPLIAAAAGAVVFRKRR